MSRKLSKNQHLFPEMDIRGIQKEHPSITDYYYAGATGDKCVTYQHGLSNFSSVQLGDERISFKKSLSQMAYSLDSERADALSASAIVPSLKTMKQRVQDYDEAKEIVGSRRISEMEQMMRDKLQQRTKTGPFQLRKTFKYFDRDGSGGIDFSEFQRAMELMGFQFSDIQQLALFARYDDSRTGEVNYHDFVENLMESDFQPEKHSFLDKMSRSMLNAAGEGGDDGRGYDDDSETEEEEKETFLRTELNKIFRNLDADKNGHLDRNEVRGLLKSLGREMTKEEFETGFARLDLDGSGHIDFEEFYEWYKVAGGKR